MLYLPARNRKILLKNIHHYKKMHFPGKGSGLRLADEVGVAPQTVSNWLSGRRIPTFHQLYRLAKTFNISPLKLCGIKERSEYFRNSAHILILRALLEYQEDAIKGGANPHVIANFLTEIKELLNKELDDTT